MSETFDAFPEEVRDDVESLESLGYLEDSFEKWGHSFTLRTLKGDEELAASVVSKPFVDTLGQGKAWAWANVALALAEVDGDPEFCPPIGPDTLEFARGRFRYCTKKWHWPIAEFLFSKFVALQKRQVEALEAVRDFPFESPDTSPPGRGSLSDFGLSLEDLAPEED
jgi:hypothetical protein